MPILVLKSRLAGIRVTGTYYDRTDPVRISEDWAAAAGLACWEKVTLENHETGKQVKTYVVVVPGAQRLVEVNGPLTRDFGTGDLVSITAFASIEEGEAGRWSPRIVKGG